MPRIQIPFPFGGLSDAVSFDAQPAGTTRDARNVRARNPKNGRIQGSQRSGSVKYVSSQISGANPVRRMLEIGYAVQNVAYTSLGDAVAISESITLPNGRECKGAKTDRHGNVYALDGLNGVVKYNAAGVIVWKCALPAKDPGHECRALWVDDSLRVFVGTSAGSNQKESRIWCIRQLDENKTEILWEIAPERWVESIRDASGMLYTIQNDTDFWKSYVVVYVNQDIANPTEIRNFPVSYPANGFTVSPKDGSLFVTNEPNTQRGLDPRSPGTTAPSVDWTPLDLANFNARIWSWYRADDIDGNDTFNSEYLDGDLIQTLFDRSGKFRHLTQTNSNFRPILRKGAVAGRDVLLFDGTDDQLVSGTNVSVDPAYRDTQRTIVPMYKKAQWVLYGVVRTTSDATRRGFLSLPGTTKNRHIIFNRRPGDTLAGAATAPGEPYEGLFSYYEDTTGSTDVAGGSDGQPRDGVLDEDGYAMFAIVHDGGQTDVAGGTETRSTVWFNASPVDRWISVGDFTGTAASVLGTVAGITAFFQGYLCELLCISDWSSPSYTLGSGTTLNRLITYPAKAGSPGGVNGWPDYTDTAPAYWAVQSDTEFDRLQMYFMHRWGIAHKAPAGKQELVTLTAQPTNPSTMTLCGQAYRFVSPITATAGDVLIGATVFATARNLHRAINGTGTPGTDYAAATPVNTVMRSVGVHREANITTANVPTLVLRTREGSPGSATVTLAAALTANVLFEYENTAPAGPSPTTASSLKSAGTTQSEGNLGAVGTVTGGNRGFYPTAFWLTATPQSEGGPPRVAGVTTTSVVGDANKPYGMLVKYDPASGKARWCAVSDAGNSGVGIGGVGYGVEANSAGELYTSGPRQAADPLGAFSADNIDTRKIIDTGNDFSIAGGGSTATSAWTDATGEQTYKYPRLAVDKFDNVFVPIFHASPGTSLIGFARTPSAGAGVKITTVTTLTDDPRAYAVAIPPASLFPDYPSSFTNTRPEYVWLATELAGTNTATMFKIGLVSIAQAGSSSRQRARVAVSAGVVTTFVAPATVTTLATAATSLGAGGMDSAARFIDACALFSKGFIVDGHNTRVYDPKLGTFGTLRPSGSGEVPPRPRLCAAYRGRLVLGSFNDNAHGVGFSEQGNPSGWDINPAVPSKTQAVLGAASKLGNLAEMVTAIAPVSDHYMILGCDGSIWLLRGDPADGGEWDCITRDIGIAFGRAWCFDPRGMFWFLSTEGGLYRMGSDWVPQPVSEHRIARRLATLDLTTFYPELAWDSDEKVLRIGLFPYGAASLATHYAYEPDTEAFWEDTYANTSVQPTSYLMIDGDAAADRRFLMGCGDGYVRVVDRAAKDDDGVRIDSRVLCGPIAGKSGYDVSFSELQVVLGSTDNGAAVQMHATDTPDVLGDPVWWGELQPGHNGRVPVKVAAPYVALMVRGLPGLSRWCIESMDVAATPVGMARVR